MNRQYFLHKAEECICVDREEQYGSPEEGLKQTVILTLLGIWPVPGR